MAKASSQKRVLINRANQRVLIATSLSAFVVVFCLVAAHTLFSQLLYQNRIVSAKKQALSQLKTDSVAVASIEKSYQTFVGTPQNVLGGNTNGTGSNDGDNGKIVLDALPSQYDFPALATSIQKILNIQGLQVQSISGTDDEVAQSGQQPTGDPQPVPIPFEVTISGNYSVIQSAIQAFDSSIRPIQIQTITLTGSDSTLTADITAQTYYQPQKVFMIGSEDIH